CRATVAEGETASALDNNASAAAAERNADRKKSIVAPAESIADRGRTNGLLSERRSHPPARICWSTSDAVESSPQVPVHSVEPIARPSYGRSPSRARPAAPGHHDTKGSSEGASERHKE